MYNSGVTNCYSFKHGLEVHKKYLDFICKDTKLGLESIQSIVSYRWTNWTFQILSSIIRVTVSTCIALVCSEGKGITVANDRQFILEYMMKW